MKTVWFTPLAALFLLAGCSEQTSLRKQSDELSLTPYQWHLNNTGQKSGSDANATAGEDLHMGSVWEAYRGYGIKIAIVDTGADAIHYDLAENLSMTLSGYYYNGGFVHGDPTPSDAQRVDEDPNSGKLYNTGFTAAHGTACAGIAAAADNGIGVTGVAPRATIVALNTFADDSKYQTNSFEHALYHTGATMDISSNSWNNDIGVTQRITDDSPEIDAIQNGTQYGRNGKGIVYLFAAGNERLSNTTYPQGNPEMSDDSNWHRELNTPYVIAVAALNADGNYSSYSNFGANILIAAFGGEYGIYHPAIVTTDLIGNYGFDSQSPKYLQQHFNVPGNEDGDFTHIMNGTSAATPMMAGVVALILDANPNLTYRDVRYILATTARKNDQDNTDWVQNGAGHWINHNYGFGVADVNASVALAQNFSSLYSSPKDPFSYAAGSLSGGSDLNTPVAYLDANTSRYTRIGSVTVDPSDSLTVDYAELTLDMIHDFPGDLDIILQSPAETNSSLSHHVVRLHPINDDDQFFYPFTLGSVRYLDENSSGTWNIYIRDHYDHTQDTVPAATDSGTLYGYKLTIYGR